MIQPILLIYGQEQREKWIYLLDIFTYFLGFNTIVIGI